MENELKPIPAPVVNTEFEIDLFGKKAKILGHENFYSYDPPKGIVVNIFPFNVEIILFGINENFTTNKIDTVNLKIVFLDFSLTKFELKFRWIEFLELVTSKSFEKYIVDTIFVSMQNAAEEKLGWK